MSLLLSYGVFLSGAVSLASLIILVIKIRSFGPTPFYGQSRKKGSRGIIYAFTKGMMPWEKESARRHFLTYGAGVFYHLGIFSALIYILSLAAGLRLSFWPIFLWRLFIAGGLINGSCLFIRRISSGFLRTISCADDYTANILVDLTLLIAFLSTYINGLKPLLFGVSIVLFLYIPMGKIRHCFFFFYSRVLFGLFFGRRGVLPQPKSEQI